MPFFVSSSFLKISTILRKHTHPTQTSVKFPVYPHAKVESGQVPTDFVPGSIAADT